MIMQPQPRQNSKSGRQAGRLQVYTGDGKGKTTAALGLTLRAVGAGWRVLFAQFAKNRDCAELAALRRLGESVQIRRYGSERFLVDPPTPAERQAARAGLREVAELMREPNFDLVILDEANIAVRYNLFSVDELLSAIDGRASGTEVAVTGRHAHPTLLTQADLVTEMRKVKHYFDRGLAARRGIEH